MPDNVTRLLTLAEAEFPDLTEPEREVVRCAASGEQADLTRWGPQPAEGENSQPGGWLLRSSVVEWLCTNKRAKGKVHHKGVIIIHASLDEELDLQNADVPFFFGLHACRLPGLNAQEARFSDSLYLQHCHIEGVLNIHSSRIGGQLRCDGALVRGANGVSINADRAEIGSNVFLSQGFRAVGEVRLHGAKIQGQLYCKGGWFLNRNGYALNTENADIGNHVFLAEGFHAVGEVRLLGAIIKGQLYCKGGQFLNRHGTALDAENANIGNHVFLSEGFRAVGEVRLPGAKIKGQLNCTDGRFLNRNGFALCADNVDIGSNVFLSEGFRAVGEVRLPDAKIKGQLNCTDGRFLNRNGFALCADNVDIGSNVFLSQGFRAVGEVRLPGSKIQGQLNCINGAFSNKNGFALHLQGALVSDAMFLEPKRLRGKVCLHSAEIKGTLRMRSTSTAKASLDLRGAKVGILFDSRESWPDASRLTLDGFEYGDISHESPRSAKERFEWLGRMPNGQFLPQPYEQLAKWFQRTGHDSEAKAIRIAKEEKRLKHMSWEREPYQRVFWHLAGLLVDYGYRPQKIIPYLLTLICTCAFFFWVGYPQSMTQSVSYQYAVQQENASLGHANATNYPAFNPIIYSIDVALPIVDLQQERYWMPDSESKFGATYWFVNWLEVLAGWVLTSFAIAGATGIIRKD